MRQYKHQEAKNAVYPTNGYRMTPVATGMTLRDARGLEALITTYSLGALNNMINSISPKEWKDFEYELKRAVRLMSSYVDD